MSGDADTVGVRMELSRILIREMTDMQVIELTEVGGDRSFPIVIGLPEAFAIERRLKGIRAARPQTHDLLSSVVDALGGRLVRIEIHTLDSGTFHARIVACRADGEEVDIISRHTNEIAVGEAIGVPIYVSEQVLAEAAKDPQGFSPSPPDFEDQE